jgi:carboxymethylenebutenolidase
MAPTAYDPTSSDEQPVPLPSAPLVTLGPSIVLQPPLSRRGHGPGLIVFLPSLDAQVNSPRATKLLDPAPVQKWAEEGFAVIGITSGGSLTVEEGLRLAVATLAKRDEVDIKDKIGVLGMMQSLYKHLEKPTHCTALTHQYMTLKNSYLS